MRRVNSVSLLMAGSSAVTCIAEGELTEGWLAVKNTFCATLVALWSIPSPSLFVDLKLKPLIGVVEGGALTPSI